MKIELTLKPVPHVSGDRVETDGWIAQLHRTVHSGGKIPNIRFSLEEWEDFEEKRSTTLKYAVDVFLKEVERVFRAFLAIAEVVQPKQPMEPFRILDQVLATVNFPGDFEGHPVMGPMHLRQQGEGPRRHPESVRYDLIHRMPDGEERGCPMHLDRKEVARLLAASPFKELDLEAFIASSTRNMGLFAHDLDPRILLREGVPAYLKAAVSSAQAGMIAWKEFYKPVMLSKDPIGLG